MRLKTMLSFPSRLAKSLREKPVDYEAASNGLLQIPAGENAPKLFAPYKSEVRRIFQGLQASEIQHPEDRATIEALQKIPGIEAISSKINDLAFEKVARLELIASAIQVTRRQYPALQKMLEEEAQILDMPTPELYVINSPEVNAYSRGLETPLVALNSGLIDLMSDEELRFVLAHELGHIKCGHQRYSMMIDLLRNVAAISSIFGAIVFAKPIALALERWNRRSELSADRAGLIGCQDSDVALAALMKLAGGSVVNRFGLPDAREFMHQSWIYHDMASRGLNRAYSWIVNTESDHPQPVARTRELLAWSNSEEFKNLVQIRVLG